MTKFQDVNNSNQRTTLSVQHMNMKYNHNLDLWTTGQDGADGP